MTLADALAKLEGRLPEIESSAVDRLRQFVEDSGGLPIERDCKSKEIVAVGEEDLLGLILPLCNWLTGLAAGHPGMKGRGSIIFASL